MFAWMGVILTLGLKAEAVFAATCVRRTSQNAWIGLRFLVLRSIVKETHQSLALLNVFFPKQELAVEIGEVYCVEVEECDVAKARQDDVFH